MSGPVNEQVSRDPEIQDAKFFAAVGYLNVLCFVPIILKKGNRFAQFHGKQALVLFILEIAAGILGILPAVGELVSQVVIVVCGILSLIGIIKVLMGEYWEMPVVHEIASRITF